MHRRSVLLVSLLPLSLALSLTLVGAACRDRQTSTASSSTSGSATARRAPVALTIVNAKVWTGDERQPWAEAIAIDGGRVTLVGTTADVRALKAQRTIDAGGKLVVPGFIDSHIHFLDGGRGLASVQLREAKTRDQFVDAVRLYAASVPRGAWILNGNWDHEHWGGTLPSREWIDAVTPGHPVFVNRLDGHMALANSLALKLAGINAQTPDVPGGTIVRDAQGEPTGVLKDNAMTLVTDRIPPPPAEMSDRALDAAMTHVARQGVTSVHHLGQWADLAVFERARLAGTLRTRIYAGVPLDQWEQLRDALTSKRFGGPDGRGDEWLHIGLLKGFVDGSLGSHTAAFEAPFTDAPKDRGLLLTPLPDLQRMIAGADRAGLHVAVHAIGDRANHEILSIYERVAGEHGPRDRRFRVEHAQHLAPRDVARFAALGVIPSMQPYHAIDDGRWAEKVIGAERAKGTYAFRQLLETRARLAFGSDWFVAPPTPLEGIYAAVTRRTLDDKHPDGWVPAEKITVEEALRAYTAGGAYAEFAEKDKGRLVAGALADVAILDRDLFSIPAPEIRGVKVLYTIVGGKVIVEPRP